MVKLKNFCINSSVCVKKLICFYLEISFETIKLWSGREQDNKQNLMELCMCLWYRGNKLMVV